MKQSYLRNIGWKVVLLAPLLLLLLKLENSINLSTVGHQLVRIGIILVIYGLLADWLYQKQAAIQQLEDETGGWHRMQAALTTDRAALAAHQPIAQESAMGGAAHLLQETACEGLHPILAPRDLTAKQEEILS